VASVNGCKNCSDHCRTRNAKGKKKLRRDEENAHKKSWRRAGHEGSGLDVRGEEEVDGRLTRDWERRQGEKELPKSKANRGCKSHHSREGASIKPKYRKGGKEWEWQVNFRTKRLPQTMNEGEITGLPGRARYVNQKKWLRGETKLLTSRGFPPSGGVREMERMGIKRQRGASGERHRQGAGRGSQGHSSRRSKAVVLDAQLCGIPRNLMEKHDARANKAKGPTWAQSGRTNHDEGDYYGLGAKSPQIWGSRKRKKKNESREGSLPVCLKGRVFDQQDQEGGRDVPLGPLEKKKEI